MSHWSHWIQGFPLPIRRLGSKVHSRTEHSLAQKAFRCLQQPAKQMQPRATIGNHQWPSNKATCLATRGPSWHVLDNIAVFLVTLGTKYRIQSPLSYCYQTYRNPGWPMDPWKVSPANLKYRTCQQALPVCHRPRSLPTKLDSRKLSFSECMPWVPQDTCSHHIAISQSSSIHSFCIVFNLHVHRSLPKST